MGVSFHMVGIGPGLVKRDISLRKKQFLSGFPLTQSDICWLVTRATAPTISRVLLEWLRDRSRSGTPAHTAHIQRIVQSSQ